MVYYSRKDCSTYLYKNAPLSVINEKTMSDPNQAQQTQEDANAPDQSQQQEGQEQAQQFQPVPYERFTQVNQRMKEAEAKLKEFQSQQEEQKRKQLEENQKFQELYEQEKQAREKEKGLYLHSAKKTALQVEALKAGTVDPDAVIALADLDSIELSEDGSVSSDTVSKAIETLKEKKPYLFTSSEGQQKPANIGASGGASDNPSGTPTFKRSQLSDPAFYNKHRDQILQAQKEGKIINDF
jgi:hypothetical protein